MTEVITPIHNDDVSLLARNIASVKAQLRPCIQFVVDDCSDIENSKKYEALCEQNNVYYARLDKNVGPGLARQYGVDNGINTPFIMFLDADDVLFPTAVLNLENELIKNNTDMAIGEILFDDPNNSQLLKYPQNVTYCCGKLYKRELIEKHNIRFCEHLFYNEDSYYNTVYRFFCEKEAVLSTPVTIWCNNQNSVTKSKEYVYAEKYNYEYVKSNIYMIDTLAPINDKINFGIQIGQLYNSYQDELVYGHDTTEIDKLIVTLITPRMDTLMAAEGFYSAFSQRIQTNLNGVLYPESAVSFLERLKNGDFGKFEKEK